LWIGKEGKKSDDLRKMSELPYHLALSSRTDELYKLLTDFTFLELKAATGKHVTHLVTVDHVHYDGIYELIDDFQLALDEWPRENVAGLSEKKESLVALRTILLEKAHIISQYPETIFQSCYNHSSTGSLAHLTENWLIRNLGHNHQWLRKVNRRAHATFGIRLLGHHSSIDSCAFLDNGRFLVSCAGEDPVHVWNAETGQLVTTISLNEREQFLEDGVWHEVYRRPWIRDLASTGNTVGLLELHRIHIVSPTDWKTTSLVLDRGTRAHHLVASEDSFFVAVGRRIWIMDDTGTVKERLLEHEHRRDIEAIAVTPNGSHLASIDYAGMLIVNRHENDKWIPCIEVALQYEYRNPELFLRPIDRWNWGKQKYEGSSFTLGLTPDGRYLALCVNMRIQVFDLRTLRSVCYYQNHKYHTYHTTTISPDGTLVAFGADWRGAFKPVGLLQIHSNDTRFLFVSAGAAIRRAAFSPDGQSLAVGSFDGTISVVKTNQAKPLHSLDEEIRLPDDHILGCIVSIDKKMVACWSIDHRVAVWSLESEELLFTSDRIGESGNDRINMVGFALGGEYLYIEQGYWGDARLTIWRIITGDLVFDTREELLARGEETHFRDNRDRFSCTFSSKSAIAAVTTHRLTFLINLATSNVINIVSSPLGIIQVRMCFDELSNLLAVDSMSIGGGPPPEKTFILRYGTDTFVECDVLPQEVLDSSGIKPVESVNSLSITKHSNLGYVDDHRPGQELFAMLVESGRVVGVFPAEGCVTYIGIIPNKEYVLVGDSAGNLSILKYERRGGR
jgi:WD40 repeat protein